MGIEILPIEADLPFGARVRGVTRESTRDPAVRTQLNDLFEEKGVLIFEDVELSAAMQVALSDVFGPLKDHPVPAVTRVDQDLMPGVIAIGYAPGTGNVVEIAGEQRAQWLPWHFDHCYNNELNRAGVLRAVEIPEEGGLTGFADGIDLYDAIPDDLRDAIEGRNIVYTLDTLFENMRFGRPPGLRVIETKNAAGVMAHGKTLPRALHPAVWTRDDGRKVLHVSPWMASGIEGYENPEGDALFERLSQAINASVRPYFHKWRPGDMVIWDNWRLLHCATGTSPSATRRMHRTTIKGDYGLGFFENDAAGHRILADTEV